MVIFSTYFGFSAEVPSPVYVLRSIGKVDAVVFYDNGKIETNNPVVGVTYQPKDAQRDYLTLTNSSVLLSLSDDVSISIDENSEFKLHTSTVDVGRPTIPSKAMFTNKNHVATLMSGTIDLINLSSNGSFLLQTPRVTLTIGRGKCRVIVQGKTTVIAVLEGNVTAHKLVNGKSATIESGKYAHITTYYSLVGKGMDLANNGKPTADIRSIEQDDNKKMTDTFGENEKLHGSFIYIVDGEKVMGVKIN